MSPDFLNDFNKILEALSISTNNLVEKDESILDFLNVDKKNIHDFIQVIIVEKIGSPKIIEVKLEELKNTYISLWE